MTAQIIPFHVPKNEYELEQEFLCNLEFRARDSAFVPYDWATGEPIKETA